jgi:alpha-L-rhamnosidase
VKRRFNSFSRWITGLALLFCVASNAFPAERSQSTVRDPRIREYLLPTRIVWQSPAEACVVHDAELLLQSFSGQITLDNRSGCTLRNNGKPPGILLDFGRELHGGAQIAVADLKRGRPESKTVRVRVRFGESASEAMSELGGDPNATNDHAVRDEIISLPWLGTAEVGNTGFRFVRLDLVDTNTFVILKAVRAVSLHRDLPMLGSFRCSDERLNRVWATGAYTVFLNMQDYVWDGIKRDRLVWIGDMHPETSTIGAVFGKVDVVPASLDLIRADTTLPRWMNGISSYSLWWIIIQRDWFRHTGDLQYLRQQREYLCPLLNLVSRQIAKDGSESLPEGRFLDWPSSENKKAIHAGLHSLMILALEAGSELSECLEDTATKRICDGAVAKLRRHLPDHGGSKQAAALMALAGLGDPVRLNKNVLAVDGAKRLSTFYGYYVLQARAKAGDYQGCLDTIREFWGAMLDLGATTFWEDFNLDWLPNAGRIDELVPPGKKDIHGDYGAYCYKGFRHSLCHGWASGPTAWLSEHVLGVRPVEPGFAKVRIVPHLGDLQWAEGTFPTPRGVIKVRHEKGPDGKIKSQINAPAGVKVIRE